MRFSAVIYCIMTIFEENISIDFISDKELYNGMKMDDGTCIT